MSHRPGLDNLGFPSAGLPACPEALHHHPHLTTDDPAASSFDCWLALSSPLPSHPARGYSGWRRQTAALRCVLVLLVRHQKTTPSRHSVQTRAKVRSSITATSTPMPALVPRSSQPRIQPLVLVARFTPRGVSVYPRELPPDLYRLCGAAPLCMT